MRPNGRNSQKGRSPSTSPEPRSAEGYARKGVVPMHASGITLREQAAMTIPDASTGRERAGSDAEADRQPVTRAARAAGGPGRRAALPRTVAFWLVAGGLFLLFFAAAAPSPLYGVYQAQWRVSAPPPPPPLPPPRL